MRTDAAALLKLINDESAARGGHFAERDFELRAAIAAEAVKDVACKALGVDPHERRGISLVHVSHDQSDGFFEENDTVRQAKPAFEAVDTKETIFGRKVRLGSLGEFE